MEHLTIIQNNAFSTNIVSSVDSSTLYTIASRQLSNGTWSEVLYRIERDGGDDVQARQDGTRTELATVLYIDAAGTTRVRFKGVREEELDLDAFLRRRKAKSNSRIFVGADGVTYKWRIKGEKLELFNTSTQSLIARCCPSKFSLRSQPFTPHPTQIHNMLLHHLKSTTLSLHPAFLINTNSTGAPPQILDAIVLTFLIMQRLRDKTTHFR